MVPNIFRKIKKHLYLFAALLAFTSCACNSDKGGEITKEEPLCVYGFKLSEYRKDSLTIQPNQTFSGVMTQFGVNSADTYRLIEAGKDIFDVRSMRAGKEMEAYYKSDSLRPDWVIYKDNKIRATVFCLCDTLYVNSVEREVERRESQTDVAINSSLWNDMIAAGASPQLIVELADIYAWTVDFFGLRQGDRFRALYTERYCEGEFIDIEAVDFAIFSRNGSADEYAIRLSQGDGGNEWWNEKGESMRKAFLKAPLKFNRISSGFTMRRKHPVTGRVQPHTGVDYAAPKGTPVLALGDGTILSAKREGAAGNMIRLRHNSVYTTGYLHLSGFAKGIKAGARVKQGQVIGYVGSTGRSTGPHLDFRVWKNGSPVNPLTLKSPSAEPIRPGNKAALDSVFKARLSKFE